MMAATIDKDVARQRAASQLGVDVQPELVLTAPGERPAYYVFNNRAGEGFVIVAGDDASGEVLGWSSKGSFDPHDMPPALQLWLAMMEEQTRMVQQGRAESYRAATYYSRVEPLISTIWDQNAPFNLQAPEYATGKRAATGCMATAMAQLLKYHASTQSTTAIPAYTTKTHSIKMEALPATTFDYSLMRDSYKSSYTQQQAEAVAQLMRYCGQAVTMDYGESSGAAPNISALASYFGYNPYAYYADRYQYPAYAWEQLLYSQISAGRPVLMAGYTFSSVGIEGHAFLCDGYDGAGMFHFNWGWSGRYDGWFKLSECNPLGQGTGGSHSADGFSIEQAAMINMIPQQVTPDMGLRMTAAEVSATYSTIGRSDTSQDFVIPVQATGYNITAAAHAFDVALAVYPDADEDHYTYWKVVENRMMDPYVGVNFSMNLAYGADITSGRYYLRFVCREPGNEGWAWAYNGDVYLILDIDGNTMTISKPETDLLVKSVTFEGSLQAGTKATMRMNITNRGKRIYDNLFLFVNGKQATGVGLYVDPGKTDEVVMHFTVPSDGGTPMLTVFTDVEKMDDKQYNPAGQVVWNGPMADYQLDEVRQQAVDVLGGEVQLVAQEAGSNPTYYIYNTVADNKGFAIVSPDDSDGGVLAYSREGSFDPNNVAEPVAEWLECSAAALRQARQSGAAPARRAPRRAMAAIAPMCTTKWGQRSPYNDMAPPYNAEGYHSAAGCLAVAMAQVLKYHASATATTDIPAYTTETLGQRLEALPARTFNYAIMRDEYGMFDNDESAQEVAALMRYCGQACKMDYDVNSGAETSGDYLARYFGFASSYTDKSYLSHMTDWDELIYSELQAGRPVMYSGKKMTGFLKFSGHVFVVDGYDGDGRFHFNWGWNGNDNGYYKLTSADGYNILQLAVIGLQPAVTDGINSPTVAPTLNPQLSTLNCYDLQGRRVTHPTQGVYILNGHQIVVK